MSSFILGLTGSIAMGKTTVSKMFRELGVPVWCADTEVNELYKPLGKGTIEIKKIFPSVIDDSGVSKEKLKHLIQKDNSILKKIEDLIHPLLEVSKKNFLNDNYSKKLLVFDVPLLFEKNQEKKFNAILLLTASEETQKKRVLSRPGFSNDHFELIKEKQLKEKEKIERANFVLFTDQSIEKTRKEVKALYSKILNKEII